MFCTNCGAALEEGQRFCTECGQEVEDLPCGLISDTSPDICHSEASATLSRHPEACSHAEGSSVKGAEFQVDPFTSNADDDAFGTTVLADLEDIPDAGQPMAAIDVNVTTNVWELSENSESTDKSESVCGASDSRENEHRQPSCCGANSQGEDDVPQTLATAAMNVENDISSVSDMDALSADEVAPTFKLIEKSGKAHLATAFPCTVGKGSAADLQLSGNNAISREHLRVHLDGGTFKVEDLGSSNFTYIHGVKLEPGAVVEVKTGDEIKLADETFAIEATC